MAARRPGVQQIAAARGRQHPDARRPADRDRQGHAAHLQVALAGQARQVLADEGGRGRVDRGAASAGPGSGDGSARAHAESCPPADRALRTVRSSVIVPSLVAAGASGRRRRGSRSRRGGGRSSVRSRWRRIEPGPPAGAARSAPPGDLVEDGRDGDAVAAGERVAKGGEVRGLVESDASHRGRSRNPGVVGAAPLPGS